MVFKQGEKSKNWNGIKEGEHRGEITEFKKGNTPHNKGNGRGWITKEGYRKFKKNGKDLYEHRMIMEKHLGRELNPSEKIHHIDEDKLNNNINNLLLLPNESEHMKIHHPKGRQIGD